MKAVFFSEDGVPFPPDDSGLSQNTQQVTFGFGRMTAVIFFEYAGWDWPQYSYRSKTLLSPNLALRERHVLAAPLYLNDTQCNHLATAMDRAWRQMPWAASVTECSPRLVCLRLGQAVRKGYSRAMIDG